MDIFRTFADGEKTTRFLLRRTRHHRVPTGLVHAATNEEPLTLCGIPLTDLHEFGRSRHPFEHFPNDQRCPECSEISGTGCLD